MCVVKMQLWASLASSVQEKKYAFCEMQASKGAAPAAADSAVLSAPMLPTDADAETAEHSKEQKRSANQNTRHRGDYGGT